MFYSSRRRNFKRTFRHSGMAENPKDTHVKLDRRVNRKRAFHLKSISSENEFSVVFSLFRRNRRRPQQANLFPGRRRSREIVEIRRSGPRYWHTQLPFREPNRSSFGRHHPRDSRGIIRVRFDVNAPIERRLTFIGCSLIQKIHVTARDRFIVFIEQLIIHATRLQDQCLSLSLSLSLSLPECLFRQMLARRNKSLDAACIHARLRSELSLRGG